MQSRLTEGWFMAHIELHADFKDFLRLLNSHGIKHLEVIDIDDIPVNFISLDDLKTNK
jgi:hypothetical protein